MKANLLLKQNIKAMLTARRQHQKDLAQWCRQTEGWLSHILTDESRGIPLKYLDRIADFFGIATYQLLQPGITPLTERRTRVQRRSGHDRRVSKRSESSNQSGLTDDALVREVLSVPFDERPFLFESLAMLKRRRVESPTRGQSTALSPSGTGSGRSTPHGPKTPKSDDR